VTGLEAHPVQAQATFPAKPGRNRDQSSAGLVCIGAQWPRRLSLWRSVR
jgi:hypothetical protein